MVARDLTAHTRIASMYTSIKNQVPSGRAKLVSVSGVATQEAAKVYIRRQKKIALSLGFLFEEHCLEGTEHEACLVLKRLCDDPSVTGIILQRPLPFPVSSSLRLQEAIAPSKDVEGVHPLSLGRLLYPTSPLLTPCTAQAVVSLLKDTQCPLRGLHVVMVGTSELIAKPASLLLIEEGCTVTLCHRATRALSSHTRRADVVVVAVGVPGLITGEMVKEGAIVIDVGINVIEQGGERRVVGDVDRESVETRASWLTPVPGGVGSLTTAFLMHNTALAFQEAQAREQV